MKRYYPSLDILKAALALFIIAIHTGILNDSLYPILRIAVPSFFIISGFFAFRKIGSGASSREQGTLCLGIVKRYGVLYLFWFIVLLPATLYIRRYSQYGFPQILWVLVRQFLFGSTFQVSWYIMACIIGIPLIHFLSRKMHTGGLLLLTVPLYLFATACSKYRPAILASPVLSDPYRAMVSVIGNPFGNFIISLIYITLGKLIAQREGSEPSLKHSGAGLVLCTAGLIGEFLLAQAQNYFDRTCDCWFLLAPTAMFLVLFFMRLPLECRHSAFLRKFNTITFCSHMAVLLVLRKVFSTLQLPDPLGLVLFFATTVTCLVMTLIILRLEKRKPLRFLRFSY